MFFGTPASPRQTGADASETTAVFFITSSAPLIPGRASQDAGGGMSIDRLDW